MKVIVTLTADPERTARAERYAMSVLEDMKARNVRVTITGEQIEVWGLNTRDAARVQLELNACHLGSTLVNDKARSATDDVRPDPGPPGNSPGAVPQQTRAGRVPS